MGVCTVTPGTKRSPQRWGTEKVWIGTITMSASYATGGDTLNAASLGMTDIAGGIAGKQGATLAELVTQTDPSTAKVKLTVSNTGAEVASTTDEHTITVNAIIYGR